MKKRIPQKKLTLNRETIQHLEDKSLEPAHGGGTRYSASCNTLCPIWSCYNCPDEN